MNLLTRYRLADGVAIRSERFGGLVYSYNTRQLYFLHSHDLTAFVSGLDGDQPLADAMAAFRAGRGLPLDDGEMLVNAMASLERLGLVVSAGR